MNKSLELPAILPAALAIALAAWILETHTTAGALSALDIGVGVSAWGEGVVATNATLSHVTFDVNFPSGVTVSNGAYDVQAAGAGGVSGAQDGMSYIYEQRSGDFDVAVRVDQVGGADARSRAGVLLREDLSPGAREFGIFVGPAATNTVDGSGVGYNGVETLERITANAGLVPFPNSPNPPVLGNYGSGLTNAYPIWLRMRRTGGNLYVYTGADGTNWYLCARDNAFPVDWPDTFYAGMATSANSLTNYTQARFNQYGDYVPPSQRQALLVSGGNTASGGLSGLVSGGSTGPAPSALDTPAGAPTASGVWQPAAKYFYDLLINQGYGVTVVHGNTARTEDANGMSLVLWGGTCYSTDVGNKFQGVPVPAVFWKAASLEKNYYISTSANRGNDSGQTSIRIVHTNNPIVKGLFALNSTVAVSASGQYFGWGISNDLADSGQGFTVVAVNPSSLTHAMLYYADAGAALYSNGVTNAQPARRVGLWVGDNTSPIGDWTQVTGSGTTLLLNAMNWAVATTTNAPGILTQPADQIAPVGLSTMFSVSAFGPGPYSYQWKRDETNIPGAIYADYTTPPVTLEDDGSVFRVVVTGLYGSIQSRDALLAVQQYPVTITSQPKSETVAVGSNAVFTVTIDFSSTGPISYQWWKILPGGATNMIGDATNASYTTPPLLAPDDGTRFYVWVAGAVNTATSSLATVTVLPPPEFALPVRSADGTKLTLIWTNGGTLLSATNAAGPWMAVPDATNSPFNVAVDPLKPQQFFKIQQFGGQRIGPDFTSYVNMVQDDNGGHSLHQTALMRFPLGRIGLWSVAQGEFADCVTRGLRLYPCIDTIVNKGTADWRNSISGNPGEMNITYQSGVAARGSSVDLTVTPHVSIYRYHLASASSFRAVAMMVNDLTIGNYNWSNNSFNVIDNQTIQVTLSGGGRTIYYYLKFNQPSVGHGTINNTTVTDGASAVSGSVVGGYFKFDSSDIIVAVAISHTSMTQAQAYFNAEFSGMDFDAAVAGLNSAWVAKLGKVEAEGPTLALRQFYTALYTVYVNTIDASDNPYYTSARPLLTIASSDYWQYMGGYLRCDWDMSRGVYQLLALIDPDLFSDILNAYQVQYDRDQPRIWCNWDPFSASGFSVTMFLPDFALLGSLQGITNVDYNKLKNSLTNYYQHYYPANFFSLHYIPSDDPQDQGNNPASHTLDYSVPMGALSALGKRLGDAATDNYYYPYRTNYVNIYDAANQQFRTRKANGTFGTLGSDFFEGNGVDYRFASPQDPYRLLGLYGASNAVSLIDGYLRSSADYNDYQLIYLFLPIFADRADETANLVRTTYIPRFNNLTVAEGFSGSSGWGDFYTDNAGPLACCLLGLYYIPISGAEWLVTTPSFDRVVIHGKRDITIQTVNNSPSNNFIGSIQLNGASFPSYTISGQTLVAGDQTLTLSLTNVPAKLGNLYLSSTDGDVLSADTDNSTYLDFYIDPVTATCSAQVYSLVAPASITLNGANFSNWNYDSTTKLVTLTGVTKGSYTVSLH